MSTDLAALRALMKKAGPGTVIPSVETVEYLNALRVAAPGLLSELEAARKLIEAYEWRAQVRKLNRGESSRMVAVHELCEARKAYEEARK